MNNEEIKTLEEELKLNYNDCNIKIRFNGLVGLSFDIDNLKSLVNRKRIILSNGKCIDFEILTTMVLQQEITNKNIIIYMIKGYSVTIEKWRNKKWRY